MQKKVFVAISGGVDSAVAALLLKAEGFNVTGVFMKNWSNQDYGIENECPWEQDLKDTVAICKHLEIEHKTYNFEKEYREYILGDFFNEYERGNTPNPDVLCNKYIKFNFFQKRALEEGADFIATGHYSKTHGGKLFKAKDSNKDQTYFLYQLSKQQLEKSIFPLGELTKPEVRKIAKEANLPVADKKDSQGLCFIGKIDVSDFIRSNLKEKEGDIIDLDTKKTVGTHNGIWFYTIGQRHGIKIGGTKEPYFVASKDIEKNILHVVQGRNNPKLWKKSLGLRELHLIDSNYRIPNKGLTATIRYRSQDKPIKLQINEDIIQIEFEEPQWGPALGQSLVIFNDKECIGGGIISEIE